MAERASGESREGGVEADERCERRIRPDGGREARLQVCEREGRRREDNVCASRQPPPGLGNDWDYVDPA